VKSENNEDYCYAVFFTHPSFYPSWDLISSYWITTRSWKRKQYVANMKNFIWKVYALL
jgi:hypothetical protein